MKPEPFRVLVFSKTRGFRHECIPAGIAMFRRLAEESKATSDPFAVDASEDADKYFSSLHALSAYKVVVFFQCSGDIFTAAQLAVLQAYVAAGDSGIVGVHCATSAMKSRTSGADPTGYYARLLGAVFTEHPEPQLGRVVIKDPHHPVVLPLLHALGPTEASVPEPSYSCFDEWYNFEPTSRAVVAAKGAQGAGAPTGGIHVLLTADETTYVGGKHGDEHPIAWWQDFEGTGTRVFYTALGHFETAYEEDSDFVEHMRNAVLWAAKVL